MAQLHIKKLVKKSLWSRSLIFFQLQVLQLQP